MQVAWVGVFGLAGIFARYFIDLGSAALALPYPLSTFAINIVGSFIIGFIYPLTHVSENIKVALMVGLLGGFTTYSGYALQTVRLIQEDKWTWAVAYFALTPVVCVGAAFLGIALSSNSI